MRAIRLRLVGLAASLALVLTGITGIGGVGTALANPCSIHDNIADDESTQNNIVVVQQTQTATEAGSGAQTAVQIQIACVAVGEENNNG